MTQDSKKDRLGRTPVQGTNRVDTHQTFVCFVGNQPQEYAIKVSEFIGEIPSFSYSIGVVKPSSVEGEEGHFTPYLRHDMVEDCAKNLVALAQQNQKIIDAAAEEYRKNWSKSKSHTKGKGKEGLPIGRADLSQADKRGEKARRDNKTTAAQATGAQSQIEETQTTTPVTEERVSA